MSRFPGKPIQTFVTAPLTSTPAPSATPVSAAAPVTDPLSGNTDPLAQVPIRTAVASAPLHVRSASHAPAVPAPLSPTASATMSASAVGLPPSVNPQLATPAAAATAANAASLHIRAPSQASAASAAALWGSDTTDDDQVLSAARLSSVPLAGGGSGANAAQRPPPPMAPAPAAAPVGGAAGGSSSSAAIAAASAAAAAASAAAIQEMNVFFGGVAPVPSRVRLTAAAVTQDENGVDHLLKAPKLESMLGSLASLGGAVNALLPDAVLRVRFWLVLALVRTRRFDRAERELQSLNSLLDGDNGDLNDEVPFELYLLRAEFASLRGGGVGETMAALHALLARASARLSVAVVRYSQATAAASVAAAAASPEHLDGSAAAALASASATLCVCMRRVRALILRLVHVHCGVTPFVTASAAAATAAASKPATAASSSSSSSSTLAVASSTATAPPLCASSALAGGAHDPAAAVALLQQLLRTYAHVARCVGAQWTPDAAVLALMARVLLQVGDTRSAAALLDEAEVHSLTAAALPVGHVLAVHSLPPWSPSETNAQRMQHAHALMSNSSSSSSSSSTAAPAAAVDAVRTFECAALWTAPLSADEAALNRALLLIAQAAYGDAFAVCAAHLDAAAATAPHWHAQLVSVFAVAALFSNQAHRAVVVLEELVRTRPDYVFGGCVRPDAGLLSNEAASGGANASGASAVALGAAACVSSAVGAAVARNLNVLYAITLPNPKHGEARRALMERIGRTYGPDDFEWATWCAE